MLRKIANGGPLFKFVDMSKNAVMQLIMFIAVCYIILHGMNLILMIMHDLGGATFHQLTIPNVGIKDWSHFLSKPWVLITYFLGHSHFFTLLGNMIWLYIFGSLIQNLIGYKELIPLFFATSLLSGILYLILTVIIPNNNYYYILSSLPGVVGIAFAALSLAPNYKFYIGERISFPMWTAVIVFLLLSSVLIFNSGSFSWLLYLISAAVGYGYMIMIKKGYKPGLFLYKRYYGLAAKFTPDESSEKNHEWPVEKLRNAKRNSSDTNEIDRILDKINEKGMGSLTKRERKILFDASDDI